MGHDGLLGIVTPGHDIRFFEIKSESGKDDMLEVSDALYGILNYLAGLYEKHNPLQGAFYAPDLHLEEKEIAIYEEFKDFVQTYTRERGLKEGMPGNSLGICLKIDLENKRITTSAYSLFSSWSNGKFIKDLAYLTRQYYDICITNNSNKTFAP